MVLSRSIHPHAEPRGLRFSPLGEWLSFVWPKESHQRKGHPYSTGLRLPCDARRPRRGGNSPWRAAQNTAHCGAQTPRPLSPRKGTPTFYGLKPVKDRMPRPAVLLGGTEGAQVHAYAGYRPSALPIWRVRAGRERNRVRGPQQGTSCVPCQGELVERPSVRAKSGTRRAAMWGRLFFGYFLLAKQKKVTRPKAKSEAVAFIPTPTNITEHTANPQTRKAT